jgi:hypothetical protein
MFASKDTLLTRPSGGYNIARSVRLRSSATAYFNRTLTTPTNNQKWTYSCWFKRGSLSNTAQGLFEAPSSGSTFASIYLTSGDIINWYDASGGATVYILQTSQVFRDPSAWYHLVCVYDSTQATASNRQKMYVNGVQITAFATATYVAQNTNGRINSAVAHKIGTFDAGSNYYDGYMTEINFIDGQALTPNSFGTFNSYGVWQPITYGGSYGNNGFYLPFTNNTNTTTIGYDFSPQGNNWTSSGINVTAYSGTPSNNTSYDSMTDVPTLTSATAANYCTWNPLAVGANITVSDGNLAASSATNSIKGLLSTLAVGSGFKWYWEVTITSLASDLRLQLGLATYQYNYASGYLGNSPYGGAGTWTGTGFIFDVNSVTVFSATVTALAVNDVVMFAYDDATGKIWVGKNGTFYNSGAPASGTGNVATMTAGSNYLPAAMINTSGGTNAIALNGGQRPFSYTPPTGFVALNTYNL